VDCFESRAKKSQYITAYRIENYRLMGVDNLISNDSQFNPECVSFISLN